MFISRLLLREGISAGPVCAAKGKLLGVKWEQDILLSKYIKGLLYITQDTFEIFH